VKGGGYGRGGRRGGGDRGSERARGRGGGGGKIERRGLVEGGWRRGGGGGEGWGERQGEEGGSERRGWEENLFEEVRGAVGRFLQAIRSLLGGVGGHITNVGGCFGILKSCERAKQRQAAALGRKRQSRFCQGRRTSGIRY